MRSSSGAGPWARIARFSLLRVLCVAAPEMRPLLTRTQLWRCMRHQRRKRSTGHYVAP